MAHKLFHTAARLYIKVSRFCTTQSRLDSVNVADENPTYKTGLCKYLKEGHTEVNKYKIRKTDFVKEPVLKAEKKNSGDRFNVLLTVHHAMILGNCPT